MNFLFYEFFYTIEIPNATTSAVPSIIPASLNYMVLKKRSKHFQKNDYYGVVEEKRYDGPDRKNRWRSFIVIDEKMKKLGAHTSVLDAARNYDRITCMKYGIKDKLNFPEEYDLK